MAHTPIYLTKEELWFIDPYYKNVYDEEEIEEQNNEDKKLHWIDLLLQNVGLFFMKKRFGKKLKPMTPFYSGYKEKYNLPRAIEQGLAAYSATWRKGRYSSTADEIYNGGDTGTGEW